MVHERLPGQPVVDGVVWEDEVVETGGLSREKVWGIDDKRHNETQQGGKPETTHRGLAARGWRADSGLSGVVILEH